MISSHPSSPKSNASTENETSTNPSSPMQEPELDPTDGGLRKFKQGKLPWAQPSWLFLNAGVHVLTMLLEIAVIVMTVYWGAYAQNKSFQATLQVDFDPTDSIATDPEGWISAAAVDLCEFIQCQTSTITMSILRVRNITRSRTGIVLLKGIEQVSMVVYNPKVWGLPALSTQYRNLEVVFKNPQADIYSPPYGRFTSGGAGTLLMTPGREDPFSPAFNFVVVAIWIVGFTALINTIFVCYFDPETATDPYPDGWEIEGLEEIGNAKSDLMDPNAVRAPPTDAELKIAALQAAKDREKNEKLSKEKKIKKSLRRKRGLLSFFCFPILIITFIKASFRDTRESFLLVTTKMIVTCCQTIPLTTMFVWLSFSTPRGMTDLIFYCIVCQFISIVLAIIMWERSALRTEKNVIIRLLHPAVLRIAGARLFEITATIFIFGLFTAQYGAGSIGLIITFDILSIATMMVVTWKQQKYTLAGTTTSGYGVFRRYFLCLLLLMVLHFDHIPGKSGAGHSIVNPRMYYAWKVVRHSMLSIAVLVGISEMTDRIAGGWYAVGFIIATVSIGVMLLAVNAAMLSWQEFLDLPEVGLKIPLPKQCQRETALNDLDVLNDSKNVTPQEAPSSRMTLMALYGQKASAMEEQGKLNKDLRRRLEAERQKRHDRGEYSDDEEEMNDTIDNNTIGNSTMEIQKKEAYVFEGVDLDQINQLMSTMIQDSKSKCLGCDGLSTSHDDNCELEENQFNEYGKRIKRKKRKKTPYRFELPEKSAEERSKKIREHVQIKVLPSLSFEARRIQRLQGKTPTPESSPVVKERIPLSQQAMALKRLGGQRLF